jgi:hypothetical protein
VKLDGASFPVLGDTISYLDVGITDGYLGKLKDAIARTGMRRNEHVNHISHLR